MSLTDDQGLWPPDTALYLQKRPIDQPLPVRVIRYYPAQNAYFVIQRNGSRRLVSAKYLRPK